MRKIKRDLTYTLSTLDSSSVIINIDKSKSKITKDRVAASILSDLALTPENDFNHTVVEAKDESSDRIVKFTTTMSLKYEALMAFIYTLRIHGFSILSIANIVDSKDSRILKIDGLDIQSDMLRIEIADEHAFFIDSVIEEQIKREEEKHTSKIIKIHNKDIMDCVKIALNKTFNKLGYFTVDCTGLNYSIFEGETLSCVLYNKQIVFVSTEGKINIDKFMGYLEDICISNGEALIAEETSDIVMF